MRKEDQEENMPLNRAQILERLIGQTINVPDLKPLMGDWPGGVNIYRQRLVRSVNSRLERYVHSLPHNFYSSLRIEYVSQQLKYPS